jgi:hypothetical protein
MKKRVADTNPVRVRGLLFNSVMLHPLYLYSIHAVPKNGYVGRLLWLSCVIAVVAVVVAMVIVAFRCPTSGGSLSFRRGRRIASSLLEKSMITAMSTI